MQQPVEYFNRLLYSRQFRHIHEGGVFCISHWKGACSMGKAATRRDLEKNDLSVWLAVQAERIHPYRQLVLGATLLVLALVAIGLFVRSRNDAQREQAWFEYILATQGPGVAGDAGTVVDKFEDISRAYPGTAAADWARLRAADMQLREGMEQLFTNRATARDSLTAAIEGYSAILKDSRDDTFRERAIIGIARARESLGELPEAIEQYNKLIDNHAGSIFAPEARERVKDLEDKRTKAFYDWFAKQEPPKPGVEGPGTPGLRPSDDLDMLDPSGASSGSGIDLGDLDKILGTSTDTSEAKDAATTDTPVTEAETPAPQSSPDEAAEEKATSVPSDGAASNDK